MKSLFALMICLCSVSLKAQIFMPVDERSKVGFSIKNFGLPTGGSFKGLKGTIFFDTANVSASSFNVTVDATTINTGINARDNHLRKEEYFAADKYPVLSFISETVSRTQRPETLMVYGKLMIKGIEKNVAFPFTATAKDGGYVFAGMFKVNRRDFKVGKGSFILSDNLDVSLSVFSKKI